jgi:hypothetical protein
MRPAWGDNANSGTGYKIPLAVAVPRRPQRQV